MNAELTFRISLAVIFFALVVTRVYYFVIGIKLGSCFSMSRLGKERALLAWFLYGFICLLAVVYIFVPGWLAWAELSLSSVLRWLGIGIGFVSVLLLIWVHRTLGENFAAPGITQARQTLITTGPYHWMRHPMYTTFFTTSLAFVLVTGNWFVAIVCLLFGILIRSVTRTEEQTLIEKFGDAYREYMKQTGRFLPRFFQGA